MDDPGAATMELGYWFPVFNGGKVSLRGVHFADGTLRPVHTSVVQERLSAVRLRVADGPEVVLAGSPVQRAMLQNAVPKDAIQAFANGFPNDWQKWAVKIQRAHDTLVARGVHNDVRRSPRVLGHKQVTRAGLPLGKVQTPARARQPPARPQLQQEPGPELAETVPQERPEPVQRLEEESQLQRERSEPMPQPQAVEQPRLEKESGLSDGSESNQAKAVWAARTRLCDYDTSADASGHDDSGLAAPPPAAATNVERRPEVLDLPDNKLVPTLAPNSASGSGSGPSLFGASHQSSVFAAPSVDKTCAPSLAPSMLQNRSDATCARRREYSSRRVSRSPSKSPRRRRHDGSRRYDSSYSRDARRKPTDRRGGYDSPPRYRGSDRTRGSSAPPTPIAVPPARHQKPSDVSSRGYSVLPHGDKRSGKRPRSPSRYDRRSDDYRRRRRHDDYRHRRDDYYYERDRRYRRRRGEHRHRRRYRAPSPCSTCSSCSTCSPPSSASPSRSPSPKRRSRPTKDGKPRGNNSGVYHLSVSRVGGSRKPDKPRERKPGTSGSRPNRSGAANVSVKRRGARVADSSGASSGRRRLSALCEEGHEPDDELQLQSVVVDDVAAAVVEEVEPVVEMPPTPPPLSPPPPPKKRWKPRELAKLTVALRAILPQVDNSDDWDKVARSIAPRFSADDCRQKAEERGYDRDKLIEAADQTERDRQSQQQEQDRRNAQACAAIRARPGTQSYFIEAMSVLQSRVTTGVGLTTLLLDGTAAPEDSTVEDSNSAGGVRRTGMSSSLVPNASVEHALNRLDMDASLNSLLATPTGEANEAAGAVAPRRRPAFAAAQTPQSSSADDEQADERDALGDLAAKTTEDAAAARRRQLAYACKLSRERAAGQRELTRETRRSPRLAGGKQNSSLLHSATGKQLLSTLRDDTQRSRMAQLDENDRADNDNDNDDDVDDDTGDQLEEVVGDAAFKWD